MRAGLWLVLSVSAVGAVGAQTDSVSLRDQVVARDRLEALLSTYPPAQAMHFRRRANDPFTIDGYIPGNAFRYAGRFEIVVVVTPKRTITFRVVPAYGEYASINLSQVEEPGLVMQKLLQFSFHDFFFWGVTDGLNVFAGYTFTLESGFPEEAMKVVIRSIPLLDDSIGQLADLLE